MTCFIILNRSTIRKNENKCIVAETKIMFLEPGGCIEHFIIITADLELSFYLYFYTLTVKSVNCFHSQASQCVLKASQHMLSLRKG